ncbi:MAG: hypothetical protein ACOYXC_01760 [Candidatus Rifleibacteriota bacterium]
MEEKTEGPPLEPEPAKSGSFSWARALVWCVLIITAGVLGGMYMFFHYSGRFFAGMETEKVSSTFYSTVCGVQGQNNLQVARLNTFEEYFLASEKKLLRYLPGGTVEVRATVPCETIYHVPLDSSQWRFLVTDNGRRLNIIAPRPDFNTPAINLAGYNLEVVKYSAIRDEEEVKQLLQAQIPEKLQEVARQNIDTIRDTARLKIKEFVDRWLLSSFAKDGLPLPVVDRVFFADEEYLYRDLAFENRQRLY